jgi:hypothetical protein
MIRGVGFLANLCLFRGELHRVWWGQGCAMGSEGCNLHYLLDSVDAGGHWTKGSWKMGRRQRFVKLTNFPDSEFRLLEAAEGNWTVRKSTMREQQQNLMSRLLVSWTAMTKSAKNKKSTFTKPSEKTMKTRINTRYYITWTEIVSVDDATYVCPAPFTGTWFWSFVDSVLCRSGASVSRPAGHNSGRSWPNLGSADTRKSTWSS